MAGPKLTLSDGTSLYMRTFCQGPKDSPWAVAVHGLGEHSQRHLYLEGLLGHQAHLAVFDLRGHGRSGGKRAWVERFSLFGQDLGEVVGFLKSQWGMRAYTLFGHSMGALVCADFVKTAPKEHLPQKLVINAPPVNLVRGLPKALWKALRAIPFSIPLGGLVPIHGLSHDPSVKRAYLADPLVEKRPHTKLLFELVLASKEACCGPFPVDVEVSVGGGDPIVHVPSVKRAFPRAYVVEGAYHEIHFEIEEYRAPYFKWLKSVLL